jgi:hypothetical protein
MKEELDLEPSSFVDPPFLENSFKKEGAPNPTSNEIDNTEELPERKWKTSK